VKDSVDDAVKRLPSGDRVKSTSRSFFEALGNVILFFFKVIAKFIGIILIIVGATTLIALIISLLTAGVADIFHFPGIDFADAVYSSTLPIWLVSLVVLFAVGIPFFYVFILGLKILINNVKPLNKGINIALLGIWLASIITLAAFAAKEVQEFSREASVTDKTSLNIMADDTLRVRMVGNDDYSRGLYRDYDLDVVEDESGERLIYSSNVRLIFRSTKDSTGYINVEKNARGSSYGNARERAGEIQYNFALADNELMLDGYFTTNAENKFRDQELEVTVYLPEGSIVYADGNTYSFHRNTSYYRDILDNGFEEHYLRVIDDDVICLDCPDDRRFKVDIKDGESKIKYDADGLEIKEDEVQVTIDSTGINIKSN
ncbi:MAG: ABC transporter permease, partial [Bacteroidia bacterium]|nr:ABC transporter permease [Bacteroidia bacterium]